MNVADLSTEITGMNLASENTKESSKTIKYIQNARRGSRHGNDLLVH